ncbi:MAG TPA: gliding motility-associated C-terminal domain-containing protein [Chitinophagales bacterium]|nr:gliding motility-associated C-terminal domain-containing protein [Chitinophagales bacterium]
MMKFVLKRVFVLFVLIAVITALNNTVSAQCAGTESFTVSPQPGPGNTYAPGQVVTFCFTMTGYNQLSANWLHGLTLALGAGWDLSTLTVVSMPSPVSGAGTWSYYPGGETSTHTGVFYGAGFYFETSSGASCGCMNSDPGDNFGDYCSSGTCTWTFCFSIQVSATATAGQSLSLTLLPTGDGTSGSWGSIGCNDPAFTLSTSTVGGSFLTATATASDSRCYGECTGTASVTASNGTTPYTYLWNTTPAQSSASAIGLCPGNYTVTVTDAANATATASVTIAQPAALVISSDSVVNPSCPGTCTGAVITNITGGTSPYSYDWSAGAAPNASNDYSVCAGQVDLTVSDDNSCSVTATYTVTDPTPLTINLVSQTNPACHGAATGSLTVNATGGSGGTVNYHWSNAIVGATDSNLVAGTYTVTATNAAGCTGTASYTITEPATAILIGPATITDVSCFGFSNGAITASSNGGAGTTTYNWHQVSTGAMLSGQTIQGLSAGTYELTMSDANGCQADTSYEIGTPTKLVVDSMTRVNISCNGAGDGQATAYASGGTPGYTYNWNGSGATATNYTSGLLPGYAKVLVTDAHGCTTNDSIMITEPSQLTVGAVGQTNVTCNGSNTGSATTVGNGGTPPYSYYWNNGATGQTDAQLAAGAVYTVTVTDAHGCTATRSFTLTQPTALVSTPIITDATCNGSANGSIDANVSGGVPPYSFIWSDGQYTQVAQMLAAGTYITTVTDQNGCQASATAIVNEPAPLTATLTPTPVKCMNEKTGTIVMNATGGTPPYGFSATQDGFNFTYAVGNTASGLDSGTYDVVISDANGCTEIQSAYVGPAIPDSFSTTTDSTSCYGSDYNDGVAVVVALSTANGPYQYSVDNGFVQDTGYFNNLSAGNHLIITTSAKGCTDSIAVVINQPPAIIVSINPDTVNLPLGQSQQVMALYENADNVSYAWYPYEGLSCIDCPNPVVTTYYPMEYKLTVSMQKANATCYGYATLHANVDQAVPIYIPNAFSPNGDGNNDEFKVYGEAIKAFDMKIFDRWGEMVYSSNNALTGWDGSYKGEPAPQGIYTYQLTIVLLDNVTIHKMGSLTLLR